MDRNKINEVQGFGHKNIHIADNDIRHSGFIAQEVEAAAQELGYEFSGVNVPENSEKEMYGLKYAEFVVPLVKATQELHEKVKILEEENAVQASLIEKYESALLSLNARLDALEAKVDVNHPAIVIDESSQKK